MKVYIGADHAGYNLKEELKAFLTDAGHTVEDVGAHSLDPDDDYPDFIIPVAEKVVGDSGSAGIVIGRFGNGEVIASNKVKGVRAALSTNVLMAQKAREHNNANVLALGAEYQTSQEAKEIVRAFLETPFSAEERHTRRLDKISDYESAHTK